MYQIQHLSMCNVVLGFLLTIGWIVPCHGGGVYLYEVNATEVGLAGAWQWNAGVSYDSSMVEDKNRTLDLPVGASWRFGFGGTYTRSDNVTLRFGYELVWQGDLPVDVNRGPLAGRVSGEFASTAIHAFAFAYNKRF